MRAFPHSWKFSSFHMLTLPFNHLTIFLVRRTPACSEIRNFFDMHLLSSTIYPFKRASRSLLRQVYVGGSGAYKNLGKTYKNAIWDTPGHSQTL